MKSGRWGVDREIIFGYMAFERATKGGSSVKEWIRDGSMKVWIKLKIKIKNRTAPNIKILRGVQKYISIYRNNIKI